MRLSSTTRVRIQKAFRGLCILLPGISGFFSPAPAEIELVLPGVLPGELVSEARDVSGDGSVVVGVSGDRIWRWENGRLSDLGYVNRGGWRNSDATSISISNDGMALLASAPGYRGGIYTWDEGQWRFLIREQHSYWSSILSGDGETVCFNKRGQSYRWRDGEYRRLAMPSEFHITKANALSDDGRVAVGFALDRYRNMSYIRNRILITEAALWKDGKVISLKYPPEMDSSLARAVSADGRYIAGDAYKATFKLERGNYTACLWEVGKVMTLPPPPEPEAYSSAADVSGDGTIVVGRTGIGDPPVLKSNRITEPYDAESRACIWSVDTDWGPVDLNDLLDANGVGRQGFVLDRATAISADGTTIVGYGITAAGRRQAFILRMGGTAGTLVAR